MEETKKKVNERKKKGRGNGQGSAYKRNNSWTASVIVGWRLQEGSEEKTIPVKRTKGGFKSKKEALEYCATLMLQGNTRERLTLQQVYKKWAPYYSPRIGKSTMDNYLYAYKHFSPLHGTYMDLITAEELQKCMDNCKSGHRTHQNMKCVAGLLWGYAIDKNIIDKDITENLFIGRGKSIQREPLTPSEIEEIKKAIGKERYAEYVYCLCYLGYRPGEMLELRKDQIFYAEIECKDGQKLPIWYFINGKKTDAGKDRIVVIPEQILPFILDRLFIPGTNLLFPMYCFNRANMFKGFKPMTHNYFRGEVFKPMMKRLGIAEGKVPYGARHSYADMLKKAKGSDKSKAALIGHSNYLFTQNKYQSTDLAELKALVDTFE